VVQRWRRGRKARVETTDVVNPTRHPRAAFSSLIGWEVAACPAAKSATEEEASQAKFLIVHPQALRLAIPEIKANFEHVQCSALPGFLIPREEFFFIIVAKWTPCCARFFSFSVLCERLRPRSAHLTALGPVEKSSIQLEPTQSIS
jgi:hypothetical protein